MTLTQEKIDSLRSKLSKYNPSISMFYVDNMFLPIGAMTHINHIESTNRKMDESINSILSYAGCASIRGQGISLSEVFSQDRLPTPYGCFWMAHSPDFLRPINELNYEKRKAISIYDLAKTLDIVGKTKLITDASTIGNYYLLPDKNGNKTICETCSVIVPNKEELPVCSLRRIFGDDFRVKVLTPKELSEEFLIRLVNQGWGPLPENLWAEIRKMGGETGLFKSGEQDKSPYFTD